MKKIIMLLVVILMGCGSIKYSDEHKMTVKEISKFETASECKYTIDMNRSTVPDLVIYSKDCGLFDVGDTVKLVKE